MAVKKARFGTVEIDDLLVRRLRVLEREPAEITASAAIPTAGSH
jgi:hypothetical protein